MNVKEIVKNYLKDNGYDGLYGIGMSIDGCGCEFDDIIPCEGEFCLECEPGYKIQHPEDKDEFLIVAEKPK